MTVERLRPAEHLAAAMHHYPDTPRLVDQFRAGRGNVLPDWPDWCFLPMAAWYAIVSAGNNVPTLGLDLVPDVSRLAAIGTWRYTQGLYRLDPDLRAALTETDVSGALPADVLTRLPEWCVYIDTPGMAWGNADLAGFWAHLEWDANDGHTELRLLLDQDVALTPLPVHLGPWSLAEAMDRTVAEANRQAGVHGLGGVFPAGTGRTIAEQLHPLISVLLYLCSDEPEIDNERTPGVSPTRPTPVRTKRGLRLFPPARPTVWLVGQRIGDVIRASRERAQSQPGDRRVRPHIRRGHWHGYWRGPRDGKRHFVYHWLPPMIVGGDDT